MSTGLEKEPECDEPQAKSLLDQVETRDYLPPTRERILEWMRKPNFAVCPDPKDRGQCNVYRNLEFPNEVYDKIAEFHAEQASRRAE